MTRVNIIIISHQNIGNAFLNVAKTTFAGKLPLRISTIEIQNESEPKKIIAELEERVKALDNNGSGTLVLADLFGSTPGNIADALKKINNTQVVSGLNLPMLLRVLNYPDASLMELTQKALEGGRTGIVSYTQLNDN